MAKQDRDEDEGELREGPAPHQRGHAASEVDEDTPGKRPPPRIDDPPGSREKPASLKIDGDVVEIIEDLDERPKDDEPAERRGKKSDDEDGEAETRSQKRRRERREGNSHNRREIGELRDMVGALTATVKDLAKGHRSTVEQTEETTLANTEAALRNVVAQREEARAAGETGRANELDEAAYTLRRQRDDLRTSIEKRGKDRDAGDEGKGGGGSEARQPAFSPAEMTTIKSFIDDEIPWFDARGLDRDSRKALDISRKMGEEGYRPSDDDWSDTLRERLQEALPHRFEDDEEEGESRPPRRKSPPSGGRGREGGSGGGNRTQFRLTPMHKQALADSGHEPGSPAYNKILNDWIKDAKAARAQR